jgi:hypothetical protein
LQQKIQQALKVRSYPDQQCSRCGATIVVIFGIKYNHHTQQESKAARHADLKRVSDAVASSSHPSASQQASKTRASSNNPSRELWHSNDNDVSDHEIYDHAIICPPKCLPH